MTRQLTLEQGSDAAEAARLSRLLGMQGSLVELNRALADRIAKGEVDLQTPGLAEHLWQTTMDKLAVDQPNYASYKRELGAGWQERHASPHRWNPCGTIPRGWVSRRAPRHADERHYLPTHFGGRFSENAFGPSM